MWNLKIKYEFHLPVKQTQLKTNRVIVGADKLSDQEAESLSHDIAKKIQDEMTYPGQVKITVIRETRAVSYAK